jgi:organic radical activating enzyme
MAKCEGGCYVSYEAIQQSTMNDPSSAKASDLIEKRDGTFEDDALEDENMEYPDLVKPWDPKLIRITTKTFSVREVYNQIVEGETDLAPDFQREFVWSQAKQVLLIESILLGIPLPAFYFNQDSSGAFQVVDGVQRLTTIRLFMSNKLTLVDTHLAYLKDLAGNTYDTLEPVLRRRFGLTQLVAHVIEPQTPEEVKFDIFSRVNTGGEPLHAQEIRHCMSKARSRQLLRELVENASFDKATAFAFWTRAPDGGRMRTSRRMADRELALRFCAFRSTPVEDYRRATSLDGFLLDFTRRLDREFTDVQMIDFRTAFEQSMTNCAEILGDAAFRRWAPEAQRRGPINRAVFESQALALADYPLDLLLPNKERIYSAFRVLFNDIEYDNAVRFGTGDPSKVEKRLAEPRKAIERVLS